MESLVVGVLRSWVCSLGLIVGIGFLVGRFVFLWEF